MPTRTHFRGSKRRSNFHAGGNNTHLGICGGNKLSGLPPMANVSAATHVAYNVGNPQHHALVVLFPKCCDLQRQGLNQKPNACPDCAKQYLMNPRCKNKNFNKSTAQSDDTELVTMVAAPARADTALVTMVAAPARDETDMADTPARDETDPDDMVDLVGQDGHTNQCIGQYGGCIYQNELCYVELDSNGNYIHWAQAAACSIKAETSDDGYYNSFDGRDTNCYKCPKGMRLKRKAGQAGGCGPGTSGSCVPDPGCSWSCYSDEGEFSTEEKRKESGIRNCCEEDPVCDFGKNKCEGHWEGGDGARPRGCGCQYDSVAGVLPVGRSLVCQTAANLITAVLTTAAYGGATVEQIIFSIITGGEIGACMTGLLGVMAGIGQVLEDADDLPPEFAKAYISLVNANVTDTVLNNTYCGSRWSGAATVGKLFAGALCSYAVTSLPTDFFMNIFGAKVFSLAAGLVAIVQDTIEPGCPKQCITNGTPGKGAGMCPEPIALFCA